MKLCLAILFLSLFGTTKTFAETVESQVRCTSPFNEGMTNCYAEAEKIDETLQSKFQAVYEEKGLDPPSWVYQNQRRHLYSCYTLCRYYPDTCCLWGCKSRRRELYLRSGRSSRKLFDDYEGLQADLEQAAVAGLKEVAEMTTTSSECASALRIMQCHATLDTGVPPKACQYGFEALGAAANCAIMQLGGGKVALSSGDVSGAYGTVCLGPRSKIAVSGSQLVMGDLLAESAATVPNNADEWTEGAINRNANMAHAIADVIQLSEKIAAMKCTMSMTAKQLGSRLVLLNGTTTVLCLTGSDEIKTDLKIVGDEKSFLYVNALNRMKVNGGYVSLAGGITHSQIIWNARDLDCGFSSGALAGSLLCIGGKVAFSNHGRVLGSVISTGDIALSGGSLVECIPS
jgi:hypothetical protein